MANIKLDNTQTMTRGEVMKAREEDAEKIRAGNRKVKIINHGIAKGYSVA
jgi:hypothetical protein